MPRPRRPPKPRSPVAKALRKLRPKVRPSDKVYRRRPRTAKPEE
jgi:hypothetical protein